MRISQLARSLKVTRSEIIEFLTEKGYEEHLQSTDVKLSQELADLVVEHFDPKSKREPQVSGPASKTQTEGAQETPAALMVPEEDQARGSAAQSGLDPEEDTQTNAEASDEDEPVEVIRAKKIKLKGVTVVGKIELPEEAPKQMKPATSQNAPVPVDNEPTKRHRRLHKEKAGKSGTRRRADKGKGRKGHPRPLSYEEKLRKQEQQERQRRMKQKKKEKEKRRKKYLASLKTQQGAQPQAQEPGPKESAEEKHVPRYNNPIKRFFAWLNGEYDNF